MNLILLSALVLCATTSAFVTSDIAKAEPQALTAAQMDRVAAGQLVGDINLPDVTVVAIPVVAADTSTQVATQTAVATQVSAAACAVCGGAVATNSGNTAVNGLLQSIGP